jgi:hypothetical protein
MARNIRLDQIGNLMDDQVRRLVNRTTLQWQKELKTRTPPVGTPVDTGRLVQSWQVNTDDPYVGRVFNNVEYAEAVCYGANLPPSWGGEYRTRQGTQPGFPDLIGKELEAYVRKEWRDIIAED